MRIIAVDDERLALSDIEWAIRGALPEAELFCFDDPFAALEYVRDNKTDIAYLDVRMPEMNGLELAKKLIEAQSDINIIFSTGHNEYALDAFSVHASDYLLKPVTAKAITESLEHLRTPVVKTANKLQVKCFGNFDVFAEGKPLHFPRQKAKELFAYLIHKRGTSCTTKEIGEVLYGKNEFIATIDKQIQTQISAMMKVLNEAGAEGLIVRKRNSLAVDIKKVDCDYYNYLNRIPETVNSYMGEYMSNYKWADTNIEYLNTIFANRK